MDLSGFEGARLFIFQNDTISGFYNKEEVTLRLENLPSHNVMKVTVDILVHDSWDGNPDDGQSGPDYLIMGIDQQEVFRTTFSNSPCESTFCLYQSYPDTFARTKCTQVRSGENQYSWALYFWRLFELYYPV